MSENDTQPRIETTCQMILATSAIVYAIYWLRPVLVPFVIAVFVVSGIAPVLDMLQHRLRVNRLVAAGIAFVAGLLALVVLGTTLWASTMELRQSAPAYRARFLKLMHIADEWLPAGWTINELSPGSSPTARTRGLSPRRTPIANNASPTDAPTPSEVSDRLPAVDNETSQDDQNRPQQPRDIAAGTPDTQAETTAASAPDSSELLSDVVPPESRAGPANSDAQIPTESELPAAEEPILEGPEAGVEGGETSPAPPLPESSPKLKEDPWSLTPDEEEWVQAHSDNAEEGARFSTDFVVRQGIGLVTATLFDLATNSVVVLIYVFFLLLGASDAARLPPMWAEIDQQIREYLRVKTVISLLTGLVFGMALAVLGVPMATTFGVLAFLLNYIPNIGPLIATVLPIPLILFHPEGTVIWIILAVTVTSGIQFISGNVIEPQMMGDSTDLHPIVVLLALMFWGMMWGIVGMFLATPITAGIRIVLEKFDSTRPLADLLAGRTFSSRGTVA